MANYKVHSSWYPLFKKWQVEIENIIADVYKVETKLKTFPPKELIFKAFEISVNDVSIALIGQDCYHGENQAMGLAFSVPISVKIPPSLVNIFKELNNEFPERKYDFTNGNLSTWANREGIFLLNSALTVRQSAPLSHIKKWEKFTDAVIKYVVENNSKCIFLLLGNYAKDKAQIIQNDARIVKGIHPSPLSAYNGFYNSNIFKEVETKLGKQIQWQN